jgi:putative ABC transport system permease protein
VAATPGYLQAIHAHVGDGVLYDRFHDQRAERVAVLGAAAAQRLGVTRLDAQPAIFVGGRSLTVVGIIDAVDRNPDTLLSVLVPDHTVESIWGSGPASGSSTRMLVETQLGAGPQVARQAKVAARPDSPEQTSVTAPPDPHALADQVKSDLGTLLLGLAGISLLVGAMGIANTSLVAVLERVPEIGLRRALGARRRHIGIQFLLESASLGLLGGLVGTAAAIVTVVAVALAQQWTPILDPVVVYPAPLIGAAIGLVAGLYPAWRASRIEPVDALRR